MPSGSPQFSGPSLLVSEYGVDEVAAYQVNANGDPIIATRRSMITGLDGAEGALLDPVTGDFLFSTFGGGSRVVAVRGFRAPPPAAPAPGGRQDRQRVRRQREGPHQAPRGARIRGARSRRSTSWSARRSTPPGARDDRRGRRPDGGLLRRDLQDRPDQRCDAADDAQARREVAVPERPSARASIAAKGKKKRKLWGDGSGKFKTQGKHSAATVVGTKWLVGGPLQEHHDACGHRRRLGARLRQAQDGARQGGQEVRGASAEVVTDSGGRAARHRPRASRLDRVGLPGRRDAAGRPPWSARRAPVSVVRAPRS